MSVNYAAGLSDYEHKGKCGQPEFVDSGNDLDDKMDKLVELVRESKHCVVLTGAGISTSTGIPDFRGPKGVWTLEEKGIEPNFATTFDDAKASEAHMALVALEKAGIVKFLVTQNVDGLHIRSGFPRDRMSILHGDMFTEQCDKCNHQFIRDTCVKTMGLKHTGGSCTNKSKRGNGCRGRLKDTILDWEDALPDDELNKAFENSKEADVYLVLGSSLQIVPAGNLPLRCKKTGGKIVTVNLQRTKHHKRTDLIIHSYIDEVMRKLCERLGVIIPLYTRPSPVLYSTHTDVKACSLLYITLADSFMVTTDAGKSSDKTKESHLTLTSNSGEKIESSRSDNILKRKIDLKLETENNGVKKEVKEVL